MLTNVHFPLLPLELVAAHLETNAFWLNDMQGLHIIPKLEIGIALGDEVREKVKPPSWRGDTLSIGVIQSCNIQRVRSCCGCR